MDFEKQLEQATKNSPELAEALKDPKTKKAYIEKLKDTWNQTAGGSYKPIKRQCDTCVFSHGKPPYENNPAKAYCERYPKAEGVAKPREVYFNGGKCLYYVEE